MIKHAALVVDSKVKNVIVIDTESNFNYSALGYELVTDEVGIGWTKNNDGTFEAPIVL